MTATFTEATKTGYRAIGRGIKTYLYGWWLQVSRTVVALAWVFTAGFVGGVATETVGAGIGGAVTIAAFLCLPVVYGYWKVDDDAEGEE